MKRVLAWVGGVMALAVVASGGWYGWQHDWWAEPEPTAPVVAPEPERSPAPARSQATQSDDGPVQQGTGLPPFYEMRPSLLSELGPGWSVSVHRPARWEGDTWWESQAVTVFVVSPEGRHYRVAELDEGVDVAPVRWVAGERRVAVLVAEQDGTAGEGRWRGGDVQAAWFDLTTGEVVLDEDARVARRGPWTWGRPLASPDGTRVVERSTGAEVVVSSGRRERIVEHGVRGRACAPVGWSDTTSVLLLCSPAPEDEDEDGSSGTDEEWDPAPVLFSLDVDEETSTRLRAYEEGEARPLPWSGAAVDQGVLAYVVESGPSGCGQAVELWDDGEVEQVQGPGARRDNRFSVEVTDGALYVASSPGCGEAAGVELTRHDLTDGSTKVLSAVLGEPWVQGLVGWAVAETPTD